jgi:CHASE2 domain-containing sensor protein
MNHRTNDYHLKLQQRQQLLMHLIEKILEQQKINEKYIENINLNKREFNYHTKQLIEFNKLNEEYQILQDENRQLKNQAKENIKKLYNFINETTVE